MSEKTEEPVKWKGRYLILAVNSIIGFTSYYAQAIPSALQVDLQGKYTANCSDLGQNQTCCKQCLGLGPDRYNQLNAMSLWLSSAVGIPSGIISDRLGNRVCSLLFGFITLIGSFSFALGTSTWFRHTDAMFPLMMTGRFFIGIGVTSLKIVMDRVCSFWFADRLEFGWGFTISLARLGTVMNFICTAYIALHYGLDIATWVGAILGGMSFVLAIVLVLLDIYGVKRVNVYAKHDSTARKLGFGRIKEFTISFWLLTIVQASFYANFNPFVTNGSQWMNDKYGVHKTTASYIVGISSDVAVVLSPVFGTVLSRLGGRSLSVFIGCVMVIPVYMLVLYTRVSPIIINVIMGVDYVLIVVSSWPAITKSVPVDLVGTALGISSLLSGFLTGLSTLGVGKLLRYLNSPDSIHYSERSWSIVMYILMGISCVSVMASAPSALKDLRKIHKRRRLDSLKSKIIVKQDLNEKDPLLN